MDARVIESRGCWRLIFSSRRRVRRIASPILFVSLHFRSNADRELPFIHNHFSFSPLPSSAYKFSSLCSFDFQGRVRQSALHEESLSEREQHQYVARQGVQAPHLSKGTGPVQQSDKGDHRGQFSRVDEFDQFESAGQFNRHDRRSNVHRDALVDGVGAGSERDQIHHGESVGRDEESEATHAQRERVGNSGAGFPGRGASCVHAQSEGQ